MPAWGQVFFGFVQIAGMIALLFGWLKMREQTRSVNAMAGAAKEVHAAQTETALWQEINGLRKELGKLKDELRIVRQEKHDWRGRANKWKLWYTVARGQTMTLKVLLTTAREQNQLLRQQLHLPPAPVNPDHEALGEDLPPPEQMADPIEDLPDPTGEDTDYLVDDGQPQ